MKNLTALGKTVFLTTHFMDEAQYLADRVAVIARGEIVAEGPPDTLAGPRPHDGEDPVPAAAGRSGAPRLGAGPGRRTARSSSRPTTRPRRSTR